MTARYDTVAAAGESRSDLLDLPALWAAIKARKAWIIGPTLAALGLSFVAVNVIPPRYTGEARLLLENGDSFYTRPGPTADNYGAQFDSEGELTVSYGDRRTLGLQGVVNLPATETLAFRCGADHTHSSFVSGCTGVRTPPSPTSKPNKPP